MMRTEQDNPAGQVDQQKDGTGSSAPPTVHKTEHKNQRGGGTVVVLVLISALVTIALILSLIIDQLPRLMGLLFS